MVKIGIISFAHMHACSYAAAVNKVDGATLAAVWDDDADRGQEAAEQNDATFIADLDEFLASDIDAVIVTSENVRHREHVEAAAKAGKWILCEKPLATTVEDAQAMVDASKAAGVGLGTAFPCRYAPSLIEVKRQLDSGEFGEIYAANCTNNGSYPGGWFADPALSGGGATMDHTVHVADLLRWMLGKEFTQVYCENGALIKPGIKTDDVGSLHLEMDGGTKVSQVASWNRPESYPTWGDVTMELIGEKGVLMIDAFKQKLDVYSDAVGKGQWIGWGDDMDEGLVGDFVAAVREKRDPAVTGEDGLRAVEVTVAAEQSARTGKVVKL